MEHQIKILFVCLGNICRSPLAHGIAENYSKINDLYLEIDSAGTGDWHVGEHPCDNSIKVASQNGIDITNIISRQVKKEDFDYYDFVIGLDNSNIQNLKNMGCEKPLLLGNFGFNGDDVPDPYFYDGFEGFDKVYEMINVCVINFLDSNHIK